MGSLRGGRRLRAAITYSTMGRVKFFSLKQHQGAEDVRQCVGERFFNLCSVISSVRNPWDALVSLYEWKRTGRGGRDAVMKDLSFSDFLHQYLSIDGGDGLSPAQRILFYPYVFADGEYVLDGVIYFEDIEGSLSHVLREINEKYKSDAGGVPHEKKGDRLKDYRKYYSDESARWVQVHFSEYLNIFPYKFDEPGKTPF